MMTFSIVAESCYSECFYAKCCKYAIMLNVAMLNVVMLNVDILNVVMLNVDMLNVVMLNVDMLNVIMLNVVMLNVVMFSVVAPPHIELARLALVNPNRPVVIRQNDVLAACRSIVWCY